MSRFANPAATERFVLGDCECPGKPHDEDWMELRTELGVADVAHIQAIPVNRDHDVAADMEVLKIVLVGWNLLDHDGATAPVDANHLDRLFTENLKGFNDWVTRHIRAASLPNVSGAPSANGSRGSASAVQTIPKRP